MALSAKSHKNQHPLSTPSTPGPPRPPTGVSRGHELTQQPFCQALMQLPSELYEYCSKAIPFLSASFQGAPNLLHIHFHLTIPLNYLNSPSRKQSPSIISPSSAAHVEFGDLQIHLISSHSCQAAGFCGFPPCSPPACPHHSRASTLFAGARDAAAFPGVPLIIAIALLAAGFPPKPHGGLVVPMWFTLPIRHQKNRCSIASAHQS